MLGSFEQKPVMKSVVVVFLSLYKVILFVISVVPLSESQLTISGRSGLGPLPTPCPPCIRGGIRPLIRTPIMGPSGPGKRGPIGGPCLGPPGPWKWGAISGRRCGPCTPLGPIGPGGLKVFSIPLGSPGAKINKQTNKYRVDIQPIKKLCNIIAIIIRTDRVHIQVNLLAFIKIRHDLTVKWGFTGFDKHLNSSLNFGQAALTFCLPGATSWSSKLMI